LLGVELALGLDKFDELRDALNSLLGVELALGLDKLDELRDALNLLPGFELALGLDKLDALSNAPTSDLIAPRVIVFNSLGFSLIGGLGVILGISLK
jgi:hypothetical protein